MKGLLFFLFSILTNNGMNGAFGPNFVTGLGHRVKQTGFGSRPGSLGGRSELLRAGQGGRNALLRERILRERRRRINEENYQVW